MIKLTVIYGPPKDPEAFDRHYREVHAVLAAKQPGLRRYEWGKTLPGPDGSTPDRYLIADLWWDDADAMGAALASPEGREAGADLAIVRLRESIDAGGTELPVDERRLTRARRAVEKAVAVLREGDDGD